MQDDDIPTKSADGQHEIAHRSRKLPARQRVLLISINGNSSVAELRKQFGNGGDFDDSMRSLFEQGLIHLPAGSFPSNASAPVADTHDNHPLPPPSSVAAPVPAPAPTPAAEPQLQSGLASAKQLMNETAFATLGLRAYMFTLRLEHCYTAEELSSMLPDFTRLLTMAKGEAYATELHHRLEAMIASEHPSAE